MMTAERDTTNQDGALQPALQTLTDALHKLTEPQQQIINDQLLTGPSWYMQLWDAVSGEATNGGGAGGGAKSRPPFWVDAFQLLTEIDQAIECWQPAYTGVPPTIGRLHTIQARSWRPQDVHQIEQISKALNQWADAIKDLLNPPARWTLPYACPNCNAKHVYRRDTTGEQVRQYALQLSAEGCTCAKCHANWQPGQFLFLGRLLDTVPDNVGE